MRMKLENDSTVVDISTLEEYGCSFILGQLLNTVQRKYPSVTQSQGKRPSTTAEIKPPKPHSWFGLHSDEPSHRLLDYRYQELI